MGRLSQKIAVKANHEDKCTGRFWEGRYKSQALLDEASILACAMYVDLNPIRAAIAQTPETSDYTGAKDRLDDLKSATSYLNEPLDRRRPWPTKPRLVVKSICTVPKRPPSQLADRTLVSLLCSSRLLLLSTIEYP